MLKQFKRRWKWAVIVLVGIFMAAGLGFRFLIDSSADKELDEVAVTDSVEVEEIVYKYGIPVDWYNVQYGIVQPRQNLSVILSEHGLSSGTIHSLNEKCRGYLMSGKSRTVRRMQCLRLETVCLYLVSLFMK